MNYVKVIHKAEILLYSSLISIMSGINRLKDQEQQPATIDAKEISENYSIPFGEVDPLPVKSAAMNWQAVQQTILGLLLWMTLGLAAGFLVGMLNHG